MMTNGLYLGNFCIKFSGGLGLFLFIILSLPNVTIKNRSQIIEKKCLHNIFNVFINWSKNQRSLDNLWFVIQFLF